MSVDQRLIDCLQRMKNEFENAITTGGRRKVISLIRSHAVIGQLHEYVKISLVKKKVNTTKIFPTVGDSKPEKTMYGYLKKKKQDITVLPDAPKDSIIQEGIFKGQKERIGKDLMEKSISINIRSQLSSLGKNFDTLYERTFAESLNLHLRAPKLIMGEVYMVPVVAYDPEAMKNQKVEFKEILPSKYIPAFQMINGRSASDALYKYERIALLIIDFRNDPPEVITSIRSLVNMGIVDKEKAKKMNYQKLSIRTFVSDIIAIYVNRHGSINPLK